MLPTLFPPSFAEFHRVTCSKTHQILCGSHFPLFGARLQHQRALVFSAIPQHLLRDSTKPHGMHRVCQLFSGDVLFPKDCSTIRADSAGSGRIYRGNRRYGIKTREFQPSSLPDELKRSVQKDTNSHQRLNHLFSHRYRRNKNYSSAGFWINMRVFGCILFCLLALVVRSTAYDEVRDLKSFGTPLGSMGGTPRAEAKKFDGAQSQQYYMRGSESIYPNLRSHFGSTYSFRGTGVETRKLQAYSDNQAMQMYLLQQQQQRRRTQHHNSHPGSPVQHLPSHYSAHEAAPSYAHQYGATQWPPQLQQQSSGYHQYAQPNYVHQAAYTSQVQQPQPEWQQQQWQLWQQQQRGPWDAQQWQQYQQHYMHQQALQQQAAWQAHAARNPYAALPYRSSQPAAVQSGTANVDPTGAAVSPAAAILVQSLRGVLGDLAGPATGQSIESLTSLVLQHLPPQQQRQIYQQLQQMLNGQQQVTNTADMHGDLLQSSPQSLTAQEATDLSRAAEIMAAASKTIQMDSEGTGTRENELLGQAAPVPCLPRECLEGDWMNAVAPVCGSDGRTYINACKLKAEACASPQSSLAISQEGPCIVGDLDSGKSLHATENPPSKPAHKAASETHLAVEIQRKAPPAENKISDDATASASLASIKTAQQTTQGNLTEEKLATSQQLLRKARPSCRINCPSGGVRVCGSDGQTYVNACELEAYACLQQKHIQVEHSGPCQRSAVLNMAENMSDAPGELSDANPEPQKV